jgi:hypothetical protein
MKKLFCMVLLVSLLALFAFSASAEEGRTITLNGDSATFRGSGIAVNGGEITLTETGEFVVTGKLNNGRIVINTGSSEEKISVVLNGADLTCLDGPPIYVVQAEKVRLCMAEGTENTVTSGTEELMETHDDSRSGAAIFAEDDIDIKGPGKLTVYGYLNNGITCKDDIDLDGGTLEIHAANNGIKGSESIEVNDGSITITCGNDGLKATSTKIGKGYVEINGGSLTIYCEGNGISAASDFVMTGGNTEIYTNKQPIVKVGGSRLVQGGAVYGNGTLLTFN